MAQVPGTIAFPAAAGASAITLVIALAFTVSAKGGAAAFGLTFVYLFVIGWPFAFLVLLGVGSWGERSGRKYSFVRVVAGAMAGTGVAFPVLALTILGGRPELSIFLVGVLAGAVGGASYWWSGGLRPPPVDQP